MNQAVSNQLDKIVAQVNKINKFDQLDGVTYVGAKSKIMFILESITYKVVGSDKFTKWLWLHDFFEINH